MKKGIQIACTAVGVFLALGAPAFADVTDIGFNFSGAIGAAVTIIGAGYGIGKIGAAAVESGRPDQAWAGAGFNEPAGTSSICAFLARNSTTFSCASWS